MRGDLLENLRHHVVLEWPAEPLDVALVGAYDDDVRVGDQICAVIGNLPEVQ